MRNLQRIVVFRPGALGDMMVAAPVLQALKKKNPRVSIEYLAEKQSDSNIISATEASRLIPAIQAVHAYDPLGNIPRRFREIRSSIRPSSSDGLLYLTFARDLYRDIFRDWLFFFLLGFGKLIGFQKAWKEVRQRKKGIYLKNEHERLRFLVQGLELPYDSLTDSLVSDAEWADQFFKNYHLEDKWVIGLCPASKMQSKNWPVKSYIKVIQELKNITDAHFIIVGGKQDQWVADQILNECPQNVYSAVGVTLLQTSGILKKVQIYLGHDTGPMHIAALHGVPCISIYSSRDRAGMWHPFGNDHVNVRAEKMACAECLLLECFADPAPCLELISVESILKAVREVMKKQNFKNGFLSPAESIAGESA